MLFERRFLSLRPPPKISLKHDLNWTKGNDQSGSTVEHQPVGKLVQQSSGEAPRVKLSKPTQSKPNPICDRTEKPVKTERVFVEKGKTSHSQEIVGERLQGELGSSDRTGKPVKCEDNRVMNVHDRTVRLVEASSNKVQEVGSLEHRDTASSNANKFSTLQSMRKTSTSTSRACRMRWETITWHQRSLLDSADRESPSTTSTSK